MTDSLPELVLYRPCIGSTESCMSRFSSVYYLDVIIQVFGPLSLRTTSDFLCAQNLTSCGMYCSTSWSDLLLKLHYIQQIVHLVFPLFWDQVNSWSAFCALNLILILCLLLGALFLMNLSVISKLLKINTVMIQNRRGKKKCFKSKYICHKIFALHHLWCYRIGDHMLRKNFKLFLQSKWDF